MANPTTYTWTLLEDTGTLGDVPQAAQTGPGRPASFQDDRRSQFGRGIRFSNVPGGRADFLVHGGPRVYHVNAVMNVLQKPSDNYYGDADYLSGVISFRGNRGRKTSIPRAIRTGYPDPNVFQDLGPDPTPPEEEPEYTDWLISARSWEYDAITDVEVAPVADPQLGDLVVVVISPAGYASAQPEWEPVVLAPEYQTSPEGYGLCAFYHYITADDISSPGNVYAFETENGDDYVTYACIQMRTAIENHSGYGTIPAIGVPTTQSFGGMVGGTTLSMAAGDPAEPRTVRANGCVMLYMAVALQSFDLNPDLVFQEPVNATLLVKKESGTRSLFVGYHRVNSPTDPFPTFSINVLSEGSGIEGGDVWAMPIEVLADPD